LVILILVNDCEMMRKYSWNLVWDEFWEKTHNLENHDADREGSPPALISWHKSTQAANNESQLRSKVTLAARVTGGPKPYASREGSLLGRVGPLGLFGFV
jgi:hypothetical protein